MGVSLGPSFKGTYQLVPPPKVGGWGFKKLKRGLKKVGKGVKKVGKKGVKVAVKVHTAPLKAAAKAGKWAMKAAAKLAAKPIIMIVNKLAGRRAKYLAFQKGGTTVTTLADRKAGGQYALNKLKKAGPVGKLAVKILKFTGGVTAGEGGDVLGADIDTGACLGWRQDAAMCGMTGAEIAAAAMTIVAATAKLMKSLNKPGEAPANPKAATTEQQAETVTQPVIESDESPAEEAATEEAAEKAAESEGETSGDFRTMIRKLRAKKQLRRAIARRTGRAVPPPPPPPGRRRRPNF